MSLSTDDNFFDRCYALLMQVPCGYVTTYKDIAHALGSKAYRAVGQAMHRNPFPVNVPCHRVVNTDGRVGGYAYGCDKKIAMLKQEGVTVDQGKLVDFTWRRYQF